jgi:hypothetical protein
MKETDYVFPFSTEFSTQQGISARDFIAIMAMQGICSNPAYAEASYKQTATMAYGYADAMFKESKK